ncbi:galactose-specific lectin nattectin-like isoform X8 [Larimichthys crocea]|uniref:galactose-specific lectin nattectin-like isoform X8 n=1 Tax=Larimichthys crocea TaxID=215358 RepID=UPI000F5EC341|nr:galactose-specific lectin nattectin-like isoform X8 [Larimichthys crocea]
MNFTMKILAVSVLLVAMMALALATEAPPQAEAAAVTEAPVKEDEAADDSSNEAADDSSSEAADDSSNEAADDSSNEAADDSSSEAADDSSNEETESEDEEGEEAESTEGEKTHDVAKRSSCRCRGHGWCLYRKNYYRYFSSRRTWAQAQYYCRAIGGNLASVHSTYENNVIRAVARNRAVWIGFSDAQQNGYWFWSDGTRFNYRKWCSGQPNNAGRKQHCAYKRGTCWDDVSCSSRLPFVCTRRRR